MYPYVSSNGANLVDLLMLEFIANSTVGRCLGQSSWLGLTNVLSTWDTLHIILSEALLVWGWKVVDLVSLMPSRR